MIRKTIAAMLLAALSLSGCVTAYEPPVAKWLMDCLFEASSNPNLDQDERARETLMNLRQGFEEYKNLARELAAMTVSEAQVKTFLEKFLPMPDLTETQYSDRVRDNVLAARLSVSDILDGKNGTTPGAHRRTGYGLWQSGLEYLQHSRRAKTAYSRFSRSVLREERVAANLHELVKAVAR